MIMRKGRKRDQRCQLEQSQTYEQKTWRLHLQFKIRPQTLLPPHDPKTKRGFSTKGWFGGEARNASNRRMKGGSQGGSNREQVPIGNTNNQQRIVLL